MVDTMIGFLTNPISQYFSLGTTPEPYQRPSHSQCFVFRCADDRMISIHMSAPQKFWEGMLQAIGRPELKDDPRFATNPLRIKNYDELGRVIAPSFLAKSRLEWVRLLDENDVPYAPVNDFDDVMADPQIHHLATFEQTEHPRMGTVKGLARPVFYDGARDFDKSSAADVGRAHRGDFGRDRTCRPMRSLPCARTKPSEINRRRTWLRR